MGKDLNGAENGTIGKRGRLGGEARGEEEGWQNRGMKSR